LMFVKNTEFHGDPSRKTLLSWLRIDLSEHLAVIKAIYP